MDYASVLNSMLLSEIKVREAFLRIAEYHKSEPGIYYDCQFMSSLSDDNLGIIKNILNDCSLRVVLKNDDTSLSPYNFNPGSNLLDDLCSLLSLNQETKTGWRIIFLSPATPYKKNGDILSRNLNKQSEWISLRIKQEKQFNYSTGKKI